jgi:hypothetical protein
LQPVLKKLIGSLYPNLSMNADWFKYVAPSIFLINAYLYLSHQLILLQT